MRRARSCLAVNKDSDDNPDKSYILEGSTASFTSIAGIRYYLGGGGGGGEGEGGGGEGEEGNMRQKETEKNDEKRCTRDSL